MILETFFEKFITDSFSTFNPEITSTEFEDAIIVLFWSIALSMMIAITYRETHRGISYSQSFTQTLVILGVIVAVVMLIVGTDIARAFTLVGALSIVRFRNALKETRDVGFIFTEMAIGMACGTRFYLLAIMLTVVICGLNFFMVATQFGQKGEAQDILEMDIPAEVNYSEFLSPIFIKNLKHYSILSVDSLDNEKNRLSFIVSFKGKPSNRNGGRIREVSAKSALLNAIQDLPFITNVKVISSSHAVEI